MASALKDIRVAAGLSQEAVADRLNTSVSQISRLERGHRKLTTEWAKRLAPLFGVSWWELLGVPPSGLSDSSTSLSPPPLGPSQAEADERFALIAEAVHALLTERSLPADPRSVARLARRVERDIANLGTILPFQENLEMVLSEVASDLRRRWESLLSDR